MPPSRSLAMAGAHCPTTSFLLPFANGNPIPRKPIRFLVSSISTPSPSKLIRRKNSLRPKLLRTLPKPYSDPFLCQSPNTNPIIPIESPHEQQPESLSSDQLSGEASDYPVTGYELKESEFQLSETSNSVGVFDGSAGKFSTRSVLKFGLYLVGIFIFQTVCAVWVLGSGTFHHKDENLDGEDNTRVLELGVNGNSKAKSKILLNGNANSFRGKFGVEKGGIVYLDESELEEKIVEIRAMARNAREKEKLGSKGNSLDDDDDVAVKTGIEKEVDNRLVKLRKRLQRIRDKSPVSSASYLSKDGNVQDGVNKDGLDVKEEHGALMFKKKYKFKSPSAEPSNKPKGFQGSASHSITKENNSYSAKGNEISDNETIGNTIKDLSDNDQQLDLPDDNLQASVSLSSEENNGRKTLEERTKSMRTPRRKLIKKKERRRTKPPKNIEVAKTESMTGIVQESSYGRALFEALSSGESSKLEAVNTKSSTKETLDTTTIYKKHNVVGISGSLKKRKVGRKQSANKVGDKKPVTDADLWWLSLPYVLAIVMRRGHSSEGPQGLFTLKSTSHTKGDSSHTVAFEDRGDATNFCYLLQSVFEDLVDFSADIVPLSIKEVGEAVKSNTMKILVVKKGQLQLYAGQPLADVEMALHSLVGQS